MKIIGMLRRLPWVFVMCNYVSVFVRCLPVTGEPKSVLCVNEYVHMTCN